MTTPSDDLIAIIHARRSIRRGFTAADVDDATLNAILACGCAAPSSKDDQPWVIHAVRDRATLAHVADAMVGDDRADDYVPMDSATGQPRLGHVSSVHESAEVLRGVPLGLFVESTGAFSGGRAHLCRDHADLQEALVGYAFEAFGSGAAVQNMWLAAHSLGLRGVFIGDVLIAEEAVRRALGMDGDLVGVLALGRSAGPPWGPRRQRAARVVVHPR